jgi:F420-dependent oxidoreductase-like protein
MNSHPIRFGIASGQQGYEWPQLTRLWEAADEAGYDSLWASDHLYAIMAEPSGPAFEGWTALAALSQRTRQARIGALVNCNGFRNPCLTAKMAMTIDHASQGRFVLGLGAGWFELEHRSLGFEFKPTPQRLGALDEACRIIRSMLADGKATFHGRHYDVTDAICSPRPLQAPRPPLMIAGQGEKVLLRIAAEHADLWNTQGSPDRMKHLIDVMRRHGDAVGREVDEIEKTVAIMFCYRKDRETEARVMQMAAALGRTTTDTVRQQMMIGGAQECLDRIDRYRRVGVTHFTLISVEAFAIDDVLRFAEEVIGAVR